MSLTKEELLSEGMVDERLVAKYPDKVERLAALNAVWQESHPEDVTQKEGEHTLEIVGEIRRNKDGIEVMNGEVLGFNKAFLEESSPMRAEIQQLTKLLNDLIAIVAIIGDKTISKETVNKFSRSALISPKSLHLKDFISLKPEGELDEV